MRLAPLIAPACIATHAAVAPAAFAIGGHTAGGQGFHISDGAPFEPVTSEASLVIDNAGPGAEMRSLIVDVHHTWVGDLVIELDGGPNGSIVLLDRPGVPESFFGDSADLDGVYIFRDGGAMFPEDSPGPSVTPGEYAPVQPFSSLLGADGTWTLRFTSHAAGDVGDVFGWWITYKPVPAPGALLLAPGGLPLLRRRR